jgi:O-antigen/teichoic acid export membrane protein
VTAFRHHHAWADSSAGHLTTIARNVSTRYLAILVETVVGLVMLPFNLTHLGPAQYGLWVLLGSLTVHFSTLELGYGSGLVKFVAQYRAQRDPRALNEIASTLFFVFTALAAVAYLIVIGIAFNLEQLFSLSAEQARTGQWLLLIIGILVALNFPFSVYGGIISGFQRYDVNNVQALGTTIIAASVNAVVLLSGGGLILLVASTTSVRVIAYFVYRLNAFRVFPPLRIRPSLFRRDRLKEVTGFSIYASIIDWANKLNYQMDQVVIGMFLGSAAVAVWAPAERIISAVQRLTNQLNGVLFPTIVHTDASQQPRQLQEILLQGTRLSLAMVVPTAAALIMLGDPLMRAWLGSNYEKVSGCVPVIQILAVAVAIRVGNATGTTLLKATGEHRLVAWVSLTTGVVNAALSIALIRRFGLVGVAWGTLVPIAASAIFVLFPAACRRVGVPLRRVFTEAVFPAAWPALAAAAGLALTRHISTGTFLAVVFQAAVGATIYLALFFGVAISKHDRAYYIAKVTQLMRSRKLAAASGV